MKHVVLMMAVVMLSGCGVAKHIAGTDQCIAPTASEAKITKRVWTK